MYYDNRYGSYRWELGDKILCGILTIVVMAIFVMCLIGAALQDADQRLCTEEILVDYVNEWVDSRLEAPYHGGTVYTVYTYNRVYSWVIDGETYRVYMKHDSKMTNSNNLPSIIRITYDPNYPARYYVHKLNEEENWLGFVINPTVGKLDPNLNGF